MLDQFSQFGFSFLQLITDPLNMLVLFGASLLGIIIGSLPGLTATLGIGLLATLTYGLNFEVALIALMSLYVGAIYGGSYASILINIPGTAASAATALDGYPMAQRGDGGAALGLSTTASFMGTIMGMFALVLTAPLILELALQFTSVEYFLLAMMGVLLSGTLTSRDLVIKGWIAGLIGLALSTVGRDRLMSFPRFTFGNSDLDSGLEVVPILIGAFAIPQILNGLSSVEFRTVPQKVGRILPEFRKIVKHFRSIFQSSMIGIGIGAIPGVGEDVAGWVSYGTAKNTSRNPENFGKGAEEGLIASETANNASIGGGLIPLTTLGIPGSPPGVMLLGALMLHGLAPGPTLAIQRPTFIAELAAIMVLAAFAMWVNGLLLAKQVVKLLKVPATLFLPIIAVMSVIGSYALGLNITNLYLMVGVGLVAFFLTRMDYPIAPLVIGLILGPMADESLRRALMVARGDVIGMFARPVSLVLITVIVLVVLSQLPVYKRWREARRSA